MLRAGGIPPKRVSFIRVGSEDIGTLLRASGFRIMIGDTVGAVDWIGRGPTIPRLDLLCGGQAFASGSFEPCFQSSLCCSPIHGVAVWDYPSAQLRSLHRGTFKKRSLF